ncbi:MAG: SIMPL domain-containing protein [Pyrinomonadaceae bacterium]|nr:SIMPL domain-containing protein [Pyrinomonadaceae bacterium]
MFKFVSLVLVISTATINVLAQSTPDRPLVTVSGQAEIMVVPDEAVFNLQVLTLDKDLANGQKRNDEVVKKVLALTRSYQIPPELVQTDYISLDERYSDEEATRKPSVFLGYSVSKEMAIVLRDVAKTERLLADIFTSGVTRIKSVVFRTTQSRKLKDQARAMAIKAAQEKASALAREIGQTIGKAYSISEEGINNPYSANNTTANFSRGVEGSYSDGGSTIALGQISITARVVVSFELH